MINETGCALIKPPPETACQQALDNRGSLESNIRQIRLIARSLKARCRTSIELDDLVSAGFEGLRSAQIRFDAKAGARFGTYAEFRIRGAILDRIRDDHPLPKWLEAKSREIESAAYLLRQRHNREATLDEMAEFLGVKSTELEDLMCRLQSRNYSLVDGEWECSDSGPVIQHVPSHQPGPDQALQRSELHSIFSRLFDRLPPQERRVMSMRYEDELTNREIGRELKLHDSRVSRLHSRAVERLREWLQTSPELRDNFASGATQFSC